MPTGGGCGIISGQLKAADGARVVKLQPGHDAVAVVDVLARHLLGHLPRREILLADGTLGTFRFSNHGLRNNDVRECREGRLGGRWCAVAVGVVLGELLDELLETRANEVVPEACPADAAEAKTGAEADAGVVEEDLDVGASLHEASGSFSGVAVPAAERAPPPPTLLPGCSRSPRKVLRMEEMSLDRDGEVAADEEEDEKEGDPPEPAAGAAPGAGAVLAAGIVVDEKGNGKGSGMKVGAGTVTSSRKSPWHSGQESSPAAAAEAAMRTVRLHW
nr:unnamed protein product [Digitaria exilis]